MGFNGKANKSCPIECKDLRDIKNILHDIKMTLFGEDGLGGLVKCVKGKVSKVSLITFIGIFVTVSSSFILYGMAADAKKKDCIRQNEEKIKILENNYNHLKEGQNEIKEAVKEMKKSQMTKEDLRREFKALEILIRRDK